MAVFEQVKYLLESTSTTFKIHQHEPVITIEDAQQKVPYLTKNLLKTVVFQVKNKGWVLAAVDSRARIDYKQLADSLNIKRTELRSVSAGKIEAEIGFELGGVGPFAIDDQLTVVIDEKLQGIDQIFCGSGSCDKTIEMALVDLVMVSQAIVYPISK